MVECCKTDRPTCLDPPLRPKLYSMLAFFVATFVLLLLGAAHYFGLLALTRGLGIGGRAARGGHRSWLVLVTFLGLALLHMIEVAALGALIARLEALFWSGGIGPEIAGGEDYLFLALLAFSTVGYGFEAAAVEGPIRIVIGAIALGGFMVITWSATFLYDVSRKVTDFGMDEG